MDLYSVQAVAATTAIEPRGRVIVLMVLERMPRLLLIREFSRMLLIPEASLRILRRSAAAALAVH